MFKKTEIKEEQPAQILHNYTLTKSVDFDKTGVAIKSYGPRAKWKGRVSLVNNSRCVYLFNETFHFHTCEEAWEFVDSYPEKFKDWCDFLQDKTKTIVIEDSF